MMPELDYDTISKDDLQCQLRNGKCLLILDCRSSKEYMECHIRSAVNFSIPTIMLRRLSAGKIDLMSTIKSKDLKERFESNYKVALFILYNDDFSKIKDASKNKIELPKNNDINYETSICIQNSKTGEFTNSMSSLTSSQSTINVLHKRLKQDGCKVVCLEDGFECFRNAYPEWCENDVLQENKESKIIPCVIGAIDGQTQAEQLMEFGALHISTTHIDSACSSSTNTSDCECIRHTNFNDEPVEIIPKLFLGNASHSCDLEALRKFNIKYILNVTPDLPNVFEGSGEIKYLQIPITDHYSEDLAIHFPIAINFIEEARNKDYSVLVHCLAGVSRSVTITLAYLMSTNSLNLNEAFNLVRDRKPDISPNFHFMEQLNSFEKQLQLKFENKAQRISHNLHSAQKNIPSTSSDPQISLFEEPVCENRDTRPQDNSECDCLNKDILELSSSPQKEAYQDTQKKSICNCKNSTNHKFLSNTNTDMNMKAIGVSPDSGIEFDRWTSPDCALK